MRNFMKTPIMRTERAPMSASDATQRTKKEKGTRMICEIKDKSKALCARLKTNAMCGQ